MTNDPNLGLNNVTSHGSLDDQLQPDTARYTLTVEDAVQLFAEAGVPRSLHTRIKAACALRGSKMADEIRALLDREYADAQLREIVKS